MQKHAKTNGLPVVREELDVAHREAVQATLDQKGELIPGVEMTKSRENFSMRFPSEN